SICIIKFTLTFASENQWAKASGRGEVGKLKIRKAEGKTGVSFTNELTVVQCSGEKVSSVRSPREHPFTVQMVGGQTLAVFTETSDKLALEGMVVQRAECRPAVSESYMKLKKEIEESTKPLRFSQKLEKAITKITNLCPTTVEYEKRKKEEAKCARADKQKVLEVLFSAFEKHQYYNIRDLVDITKQPLIYLKEILWEIGVYNSRGPLKSTWELKPEYRHYEEEQEEKME
uniref:General transcription factor IIF subunit 2 n=1 Tax=Cyprinus carpio TaxID=7962 RepID=A0A8C2B5C3_CYPCA